MKSDSLMRETFSIETRVQRMLDFEAALARAQAKVGIVPNDAAAAISVACVASNFDLTSLSREAELAGNLAIPLVKQLTTNVAKQNPEAAKFVHWGATSQDVIDTALVLQMRDGLCEFDTGLRRLSDALVTKIKQHRNTFMVGRTLLQHALPITLGFKMAGWLDGITRHRHRLAEVRSRALVLQFGGAVGTLASLGNQGQIVAKELARELDLALPDIAWHGQRDRVVEVATLLGLITGSLGKIARDISLSMQTEIGELSEPTQVGRGGSSTMPHKRNPVACAAILSAAIRVPGLVATMLSAMPQEHERALGGWQAEWETLPEIFDLTFTALNHAIEIIEGLEIDAKRMAANLDASHGLIMAEAVSMKLAQFVGKSEAHRIVEQACQRAQRDAKPLLDILVEDANVGAHLSTSQLNEIMNPSNYLGAIAEIIERVLQKVGVQ